MDMLKDLISDLIEAGFTDEEIIDQITKTREKKEKERGKRVEAARAELVAAMANYFEICNPDMKVSQDQIERTVAMLSDFEKFGKNCNVKVTYKSNEDADEKIRKWLKSLGI